jgi:ribonuclease P protein component
MQTSATERRAHREQRIRRRAEFEAAYQRGTRKEGRFMTLFVLRNNLLTARLGIAATRRLGGAVLRNRAKRLVRELFRRHNSAAGYDVVVRPRRELLNADFASLEADFRGTLGRSGRR